MGSRYWLVKLHEDLELNDPDHNRFPTTRFGVWSEVHSANGVAELTDLCAISSETLDMLLLQSDCKRVFDGPGSWHWEHSPECLTPRAKARKTSGVPRDAA